VRTTSRKTIYLTREELQKAVEEYIYRCKGRLDLVRYMMFNVCTMNFCHETGELGIEVDGEIEDVVPDESDLDKSEQEKEDEHENVQK